MNSIITPTSTFLADIAKAKELAGKSSKISPLVYGRILEEHLEAVLDAVRKEPDADLWRALSTMIENGKATVNFTERKSVIPAGPDSAEVVHTGLEVGTTGELIDELQLDTKQASKLSEIQG